MYLATHDGETQWARWLDALADIGEAVGGDEPVADVLERVTRTACALLGYDFCAVFLPDASGRALTIVGSHGLSRDYIANVNAQKPILLDVRGADEAPTSIAFRTGEVVALGDIESEAGIGPWGGVAHEQGYRALVSVPLRRSGAVVGALNGYRAQPHRFDSAEIGLVTTLATQVAIALGTAQLRAREQDTIRELRRAEEVHTLLTATALRGEGVLGVAAGLHRLLGRAVVIDDVYGDTLAAAGAQTHPPSSARPMIDAQAESSDTSVILDGEVVARIKVDAAPDTLSRLDVRAIEHAAVVCALELLRERTAAEVEQRLRGSLVTDLLDADISDTDSLMQRARRLGWDLSGDHMLIAVRSVEPASSGPPVAERVRATADRLARRFSPRPLIAIHRGDLLVLWAAGTRGEHATDFAAQLVNSPDETVKSVAAVAPAAPVQQLSEIYPTVRGALDLAVDGPAATVVDLHDLQIEHLLLQLDKPERLRAFASSVLGPALDYDARHATELLRTARVLLDHDMDRTATAAALHLHPNTVAQRMRRLEDLAGVRLARPRDLLRISAALSVARIVGLG